MHLFSMCISVQISIVPVQVQLLVVNLDILMDM